MQVKQVEKYYLDYGGGKPRPLVLDFLSSKNFHYDRVYRVWKGTKSQQSTALLTDLNSLGNPRVSEQVEIEIKFDSKPDKNIRESLKEKNFLWNKWEEIWYAKFLPERWDFAQSLSGRSPTSAPAPSTYPISVSQTSRTTKSNKDREKAEKFRELAKGMNGAIQQKIDPAIGRQRHTRRRDNIASSMRVEGYKLQKIQELLYGLASALEAGELQGTPLAKISNKAQVESLMGGARFPCWDNGGWMNYNGHPERLTKLGISESNFQHWHQKLMSLANHQQDKKRAEQERLKELQSQVAHAKIPGYFPTPLEVVTRMLQLASIYHYHECWEPSAGSGAIADELRKVSDCVSVSEIHYDLRQILEFKGHDVISWNCFDVNRKFDRIVANPPWGIAAGESAPEHIRHYYNCLKPGGRLVTLCDEGAFFRDRQEDREFRDWLQSVGGTDEKLPPGSFLNAERSTGANMRIVVINKPATVSANNIVPLPSRSSDDALALLEGLSILPQVEPEPKNEVLSILDEIAAYDVEIRKTIMELKAMLPKEKSGSTTVRELGDRLVNVKERLLTLAK